MGQGFGDKIAKEIIRDLIIGAVIFTTIGGGIMLLILWSIGKL